MFHGVLTGQGKRGEGPFVPRPAPTTADRCCAAAGRRPVGARTRAAEAMGVCVLFPRFIAPLMFAPGFAPVPDCRGRPLGAGGFG